MAKQNRMLGRRPGSVNTRSLLITTARKLFAEKGYEHTTIRGIAAAAKVDPALPMHYFKSKQRLFIEAMLPNYEGPSLLAQALADSSGARKLGLTITGLIIRIMEDPDMRTILVGLIRAAASEPEAAELMHVFVETQIILPISGALQGPDAALKANLLGSYITGIFLTRYIVGLEPIATIDPKEIAKVLEPIITGML